MSGLSKIISVKEPETFDDTKMVVQLTVTELRQLIAQEIAAALQNGGGYAPEKDRLLTPEEAAEILNPAANSANSVRWLYRHANKLPFTRRIGRKNLRFSEAGLRRWIAARKPDSPR
jgi:predicted DNA-binding transcriptional regulator AlpA